MSKQDRQGVRKASDIEQKYGLGQFMYDQRKSNQEVKRDLNKLGESLSTYKTENEKNLLRMKETADEQLKQVNESIDSVTKDVDDLSEAIFGMVYPIGAIYISVSATNPSTLFGGTWEQIKDRFLLAAGSSYKAGDTGGEAAHNLSQNEIPNYNIGFMPAVVPSNHGEWSNGGIVSYWKSSSGKTDVVNDTAVGLLDPQYGWNIYTNGGGAAHNNMPPYLAVYVWKRTA